MPPSQLVQQDFALGACPAIAPHLIPSNGILKGVNVLLDDDGSLYKRSGTSLVSSADFGALGLRLLWQGTLAGGDRTVFADPDNLGVLAADGVTPIRLAASGVSLPVRPVVIRGMLFVGPRIYGGSLKGSSYSAGTMSRTQGSATVTGTGTSWLANVDPGMLFVAPSGRVYPVKSVESNTSLTLAFPIVEATASGSYALAVTVVPSAAYNATDVMDVVAGRLVSCSGNIARFSESDDPFNFFDADGVINEHEIPDGVQIVGAASLRDTEFLFTTGGLWAVSNMNFNLVDDFGNVQQRLDRINADLVLWSNEGIATWQDQLVVPAVDGVWLIGAGTPELLSRSITPTYTAYVTQGYRTGIGVVFKSLYLLPILNAAGSVMDLLVCRLDRPSRSRIGTIFPWTQLQGAGARVTALAAKSGVGVRRPTLLGACRDAPSRVVAFGAFTADGKADDHDGSTFPWEIVMRDIATGGQLNLNHVGRLRCRYELVSADAVADVQAFYATDARPDVARWNSFNWGETAWADTVEGSFAQLTGDGPESAGDVPFVWPVNKKARYIRIRLKSGDQATRFVLRSVELFVRLAARP
jgi:hypothetical protein